MRRTKKPYRTGRPPIPTVEQVKANPRFRTVIRELKKEFRREPIRILK